MTATLTIGSLAQAAGVNIATIRYYQRRGLLEEPDRPLRGYRRYPVDMAKRVRFIKRAQALGFTLEEIIALMRLEKMNCCADTRMLATHKVASIKQKLADLTAMKKALMQLINQCDAGNRRGKCPIIDLLGHD
ncbi:MAG: Hg(II)-responsive transcriptional regulator [Alphaproteobacteria bacterium]|nr:Hg(II)-responsive transcriptional regulator [Alphaproteobacteria bacterium]